MSIMYKGECGIPEAGDTKRGLNKTKPKTKLKRCQGRGEVKQSPCPGCGLMKKEAVSGLPHPALPGFTIQGHEANW